jgi:2-amino-4-hydroxy-6-hydroxymethyldihydropteridine diphosphokinase
MINKTYLLLGSNLGNSMVQLAKAHDQIKKYIGDITDASSLYKTQPWGFEEQPYFLNQIVLVETKLSAQQTMIQIDGIEKEMGRVRTVLYAPRTIDIDILFFNNEKHKVGTFLTVPHPQIQYRMFVLKPLEEIAPNYIHPVLKKTATELIALCDDNLNVQKI